jgi:hypothetical protein
MHQTQRNVLQSLLLQSLLLQNLLLQSLLPRDMVQSLLLWIQQRSLPQSGKQVGWTVGALINTMKKVLILNNLVRMQSPPLPKNKKNNHTIYDLLSVHKQ